MKFSDLKSLHFFKVVIEEGSLTAAAKKVGVDKGNLSRRLKNLEEEAGKKLFIKSSRGIEVSKDGAELLVYAKKMLAEQEAAADLFNSKKDDLRSLNILGTYGTTSLITVQKLHAFFLDNKDFKFNILASEKDLRVESSTSDVSIRPHTESAPNLIQIPFITYQFKLFCSKSYIQEMGNPKTAKELDTHRLIGFVGRSILGNVNELLHKEEDLQNPRSYFMTTNSSPALVEAAKHGLGIICLSDTTENLKEMGIVNILPDIKKEVHLSIVYRSEIKYNKIIEKLSKFIEEGVCHEKNKA